MGMPCKQQEQEEGKGQLGQWTAGWRGLRVQGGCVFVLQGLKAGVSWGAGASQSNGNFVLGSTGAS